MEKITNKQLSALIAEENNIITILANSSALLNEALDDINWVGYYLYQNDELVLGPFQGKVACMHISLNAGVCGKAASTKKIIRVDDVHQFPGHIACDSASNSEIVLPIIIKGKLYGVLDIDSPTKKRFSSQDEEILSEFVQILENKLTSINKMV